MNYKALSKAALMTMLLTAACSTAMAAPPDEQGFMLDEVVVTAARTENKLIETAANIAVVTAEDFSRKNYQTVSEALEDVPGVIVKRSGFNGGDQHVYLNGDDRVLIMVDGRRLNQDKGTSGRSGFDMTNLPTPEYIERVEILKGAGTSLYGSDAVGGVINIITKSAKSNFAKVNINAGSWGTENYSAVLSVKEGRTGIYATANKQKQDYVKFKQADNSKNVCWPNSANEQTGATLKIDQEIGDDQLATVYFEHSFKDGGKPYYAPGLGGWNTIYPVDSGTDLNNNVAGHYEWNKDQDNKGYVQVYRNHYVGNFYRQYGNSYYYETKDGVELQQNIKLSENNSLIVGAEWREAEVNNPGTYGGKIAKINNKALFLQDSWQLTDSWTVNGGLRYDKHNYFGNETTLSLSVNKKLDANSHAYVSWGQIFNAPQANDLFYYSPGGSGYGGSYGNPNLKPETGDVFTIGYDAKLSEKLNIGVNAFYSDLQDAIKWAAVDPNNTNGDWTVKNVAEQKKRGLELNGKYALNDAVSLNASYAYVKVEEKNPGADFARDKNVAPNQYKVGVSYSENKWQADLYGRGASGADKSKYVDSKYLTLDLSLQYRPEADWKLYLKGYNLTNAAYAESGGVDSGKYMYPASGRAILIGTEYSF